MSEDKEDYYKDIINDLLKKPNNSVSPEPLPKLPVKEIFNTSKPKESVYNEYNYNKDKYEEIYIDDLPMGEFYPKMTKMYVRSCTTDEIQNYSTYDRNNPFEFKNKLFDIIERCVIYENPDGTLNSCDNLYFDDIMYLIYTIHEKTFPNGACLTTTVKFLDINNKQQIINIENNRKNIEKWENQEIMKYFNDKVFIFNTTLSDTPFEIMPPTIGLKKCIEQYLQIKIKKNIITDTDSPFFKIAPYLKPHISYMSYEELETFEYWFKNEINPEQYSFLYDLINNHLKIGIRGLKKNISGAIIRTHKLYPDKPESIFIVPNAFKLYSK